MALRWWMPSFRRSPHPEIEGSGDRPFAWRSRGETHEEDRGTAGCGHEGSSCTTTQHPHLLRLWPRAPFHRQSLREESSGDSFMERRDSDGSEQEEAGNLGADKPLEEGGVLFAYALVNKRGDVLRLSDNVDRVTSLNGFTKDGWMVVHLKCTVERADVLFSFKKERTLAPGGVE